MVDNTVQISANGITYQGFKSLRLTRGIEAVPSNFEASITEAYVNQGQIQFEPPGSPCTVQIGADIALTGYLGPYSCNVTGNSLDVGIRGSSKFGDLVRCSAVQKFPDYPGDPSITGNGVIGGMTINQISEILCTPFSIQTTGQTSSVLIPQQVFNLGESGYSIIERLSRFARLLVYDDTSGNLVFANVGQTSMASGVTQGVNFVSGSVVYDQDERFSDVYVYWQSVYSDQAIDATNSGNLRGYAADNAVKRFKPLIITSEQVSPSIDLGQARAQWEVARRYGRSQPVTLIVDSWRDSAGKLWEPNALIPLNIPILKVNQVSWLIAQVSYLLNEQGGMLAELICMPQEAFAIEPVSIQPYAWDVQLGLNAGVPLYSGGAPNVNLYPK